jgi:hypothetical protein
MKKGKAIVFVLPIIILSTYIVFYDTIETKPDNAGFWMILALGISIGALICRIFRK